MAERLRVGVIFGGRSGEHEVSLLSARSVMDSMDRERYEVIPIGITKEGRWILVPDTGGPLDEAMNAPDPQPVAILPDPSRQGLLCLHETGQNTLMPLDVVFPVLHGPMGEDGTVQGLLELARIPYVGAGVLGSAAGMDKIVMKTLFSAAGLSGPDYMLVRKVDWEMNPVAVTEEIEQQLSYPMFVKPANLGSSVGITKAHNRDELASALNAAALFDRRIIVEEGIVGAREIEVSVLGNDFPEASFPGEIVPAKEFYDYEAKYFNANSRLLIPAPLSEEVTEEIRDMAVLAFQTIDGAGLSRVDFFYCESEGRILINEINTLPGFTRISMYSKLWEATGVPYAELVDRLIGLALERHAK